MCRAPGMSAFIRLIERRNVDLPHPDGPMNAVTERAGIVRFTSNSACFSPYQNEKSLATIVPGCVESALGRIAGGRSSVAFASVIRSGP